MCIRSGADNILIVYFSAPVGESTRVFLSFPLTRSLAPLVLATLQRKKLGWYAVEQVLVVGSALTRKNQRRAAFSSANLSCWRCASCLALTSDRVPKHAASPCPGLPKGHIPTITTGVSCHTNLQHRLRVLTQWRTQSESHPPMLRYEHQQKSSPSRGRCWSAGTP